VQLGEVQGGTGLGQKPKIEPQGLVLVSKMWVGSVLGRGDLIGVGYTGVEVVRGCNQARRKVGWFGPKNQKLSHWGSILGRGDPIRAGYAGVEVVRGRDRVRHKGGLVWATKLSPAAAVAAVATLHTRTLVVAAYGSCYCTV
jgi:hypothetical protein